MENTDINISDIENIDIDKLLRNAIGRIEEIKSKSELMNDGMDYQSIDKYAKTGMSY